MGVTLPDKFTSACGKFCMEELLHERLIRFLFLSCISLSENILGALILKEYQQEGYISSGLGRTLDWKSH